MHFLLIVKILSPPVLNPFLKVRSVSDQPRVHIPLETPHGFTSLNISVKTLCISIITLKTISVSYHTTCPALLMYIQYLPPPGGGGGAGTSRGRKTQACLQWGAWTTWLRWNPAMPRKTVTSDKLVNLFVLQFPPKWKEENNNNSSYLVGLLWDTYPGLITRFGR